MQMRLEDGELQLRYLDNTQFTVIRSWSLMRWDKSKQILRGAATAELLNKLSSISRLTEPVAKERERLNRIQEAVDAERTKENPEPLYKYPVKAKLFKHQTRAANMAMIVFGLVEPQEDGVENERERKFDNRSDKHF